VKTIMPSLKDIASCILPALLDYLETHQKVRLLQTLNRQVKKCTHSVTLVAHLCLYKNNSALPSMVAFGAIVRIQKNLISIFCKWYLNTTKWKFYFPNLCNRPKVLRTMHAQSSDAIALHEHTISF